MASDGGGVPNSKQHARPQKPYDRRTSIVRRMRETMKDMMSPSWLVDLVHSVRKPSRPSHPAQSMNNIGQQATVSRNQTVCSEVRNTHSTFVPINQAVASSSSAPSSRAATFTSDGPRFSQSHAVPLQGQSTCVSGQTVYSSPAVYTQPPPEYTQESGNYTQPKADDQSEVSEYSISTSGCSSLVPHPDQREYQRDILQLSESTIVQMRQELGGSVTPSKEIDPPVQCRPSAVDGRNVSKLSISDNNKSFLWSSNVRPSRPSRPQPPAKSQRPAFNVSIFGSPIQTASSRRHELGQDYQQSPYYPGKTTFGGAAAHRKNRLKHSAPYHSPLTKRQVTARPLNNSTLGGVTSSTAKRILDTLEKMSTPIKDAKKIPSYNSSLVDSSLSFSPGNYRRRSLAMHRQNESTTEPPPVTGLAPPTMAPVMRNLQGPTDRQATPHVPPQYRSRSTAPERGVDSAREGANDGGARTGKMRRERTQHYSSKKVSQDEEVELPALPTSFTLPIGSMPTISFGGNMTPSATSNTSTLTQPSRSGVGTNLSSPLFRFSSPILKEGGDDLGGPSLSPVSPHSFRFSSPISVDKPVTVDRTTSSSSLHATPFNSTSFSSSPSLAFSYQIDSAKLKMKSPPPTVSSPEPSGFSPARELAAGSVMDILSKSANDHTTSKRSGAMSGGATSDLSSLFKKPAGSWECPTCMIQNKADVNKCVACSMSKPLSTPHGGSTVTKVPETAPGSQSLARLFQTPAGSWECPTCLIQNKAGVDKCVACETTRPKTNNSQMAASSSNEMSAPVGGNSLAAMFKKPSGSWECPTCMVQNGATHDVCPACTTPRPGAPGKSADESVKVPTSSQLPPLTGPSLAAQFAKPAGSWECDTCMVTNKGQSNKCIACETPRPATKSTTNFTSPGGFKFGSTGGLVLTSATTTTDSTAAAPVFSFGTTFPTSKPAETKDKPLDGGFKFSSGSSAPADFGTAGFKFGESSVSASTSTGFKMNDSSPSVLPAKPSDNTTKTVPFGGIQFGQSTVTPAGGSSQFAAEAPSGGFKFGAAASTASSKASEAAPLTTSSTTGLGQFDQTGTTTSLGGSNGVKFGIPETTKAPDVTPTTTAPLFGGFSAVTTNSSSSGSQVKQPAAGGFSFSQPASTAADASNSTTSSPKKGGFQFGASSTTAFTNPASAATSGVKIGGFSFGGSTKTFDTKSQSGTAAGGFSFGAGAKTSEAKTVSSSTVGGFSFGAGAKTSEAKTVSAGTAGGFSFGASAKTSEAGTEKPATSSTSTFSPMVMTPGTPGAGGFQFPATLTTTASSSADQSKSIFGSAATSASNKPQSGGFTFGATTATTLPSGGSETAAAPSTFAFGGAASTAGTDTGFAFRKRTNEGDDAPVKRSKGFGGGGGGFVFGAANTATSTSASAMPFGASAGGFGSTTPVFGASTANTAATTFNPPAFGAATSAAPATGSMFAAPAAAPPAFGAPPAAATKSTFQFGAAPTTTGMFSFGGSQPAQSTSTPKPSGGFPFGGQSQPTALGVGAAAPQQSAPSFNFSSTPNVNFGASQQTNPAAPFQFGAAPGGAPGASNSFSINRAPASGGVANRRVIKRAVRKIKK